ncbi:MAG TPA: zinc-dependent alcohol dehydrogenase family protein [Candidatus Acutalibacter stercorigallinarum]|nr:zinc-dependent alcohol dehydrogenase family protein [Candidatus Acutalibacter stercorigallinarum]
MKASYFLGKGSFEVRQAPELHPGLGEVVIKNMVCGVCGTDVHIFHGEPGSADVNPPVVLGHEYSGEVVEVGEGVTALKPGDHVTVDPNIYCGECVYCRNGKKQLCETMQAVGVTRDGGFGEYSLVPAAQAFKLGDSVPYEAGAMAEPVACCLHGIDLAGIKAGDRVCIVGGGAIGLIMLQLAKLSGASTLVLSEPNEKRRQVALSLGADAAIDPTAPDARSAYEAALGDGADVVIECVGNNAAVKSAFQLAKKGATIVLFSVPKVEATFDLPLFDVYKKELTIKGSFVNPDTHERAVRLINSGKLDFTSIITHRFNLDQLPEAIAMQMSSESIKVVVCPHGV